MKKILIISTVILFSSIGFVSCKKKKDPVAENVDASFCIKRTFQDSSNSVFGVPTELYKFQGNKLVYYNSDIHRDNYSSTREKEEYSYNADGLLSKLVTYSNNGATVSTTNYTFSIGELSGFTTVITGPGANNGNGYPTGKYYRNANHQIVAFVKKYSATNVDSTVYEYNSEGKINYKQDYSNGVIWRDENVTEFDNVGRELKILYKSYNSSGSVTSQEEHATTYFEVKNPLFEKVYQNVLGGFNNYNFDPYMDKTQISTNKQTNQLIDEYRYTITNNAAGQVVKYRKEKYDTATSQWKFVWDYDYEYTCD